MGQIFDKTMAWILREVPPAMAEASLAQMEDTRRSISIPGPPLGPSGRAVDVPTADTRDTPHSRTGLLMAGLGTRQDVTADRITDTLYSTRQPQIGHVGVPEELEFYCRGGKRPYMVPTKLRIPIMWLPAVAEKLKASLQ